MTGFTGAILDEMLASGRLVQKNGRMCRDIDDDDIMTMTVTRNKRLRAMYRMTALLRAEALQSMQMIAARSRNMSALNYTSRRRHLSSVQKAHLLRNFL